MCIHKCTLKKRFYQKPYAATDTSLIFIKNTLLPLSRRMAFIRFNNSYIRLVTNRFIANQASNNEFVPKLNISKLTYAQRLALIDNWTHRQYRYLNNIQNKNNISIPLKTYQFIPLLISKDNIEFKITNYLNSNINILNINNSLVFLKGKLSTDELINDDIIDNNVINDFPLDIKELSYQTSKKMRSYLWKFFFTKQIWTYSSLAAISVFLPSITFPYVALATVICAMKDYLTVYNYVFDEIWYKFLIKHSLIEPLLDYVEKQDKILKEKYLGPNNAEMVHQKTMKIKEL